MDAPQPAPEADLSTPECSGAVEPARRYRFASGDLCVHVSEWGSASKPPLVLCHGFWDHGRGFATLAPLLADGGYRVCAIDARGHGDSDWAHGYLWWGWVGDVVRFIESLGREVAVVGHSFGGGIAVDTAVAVPQRVRRVVNIDGFGPPPDPADAPSTRDRLRLFLDHRRKMTAQPGWRPYAHLEDLVERRRAQNPRLPLDWLRYFVFHGARSTPAGWAWKADPQMIGSAGPWKPEFVGYSYAALRVPLLAIEGTEDDTWGPMPESIVGPRLARAADVSRARIAGAGHFVHMERPRETAVAILDFLG